MAKRARTPGSAEDVEAVTRAVLTASRLLVAVSARSLGAVEDTVTLPQFRVLVVLSTHGPSKLVDLAEQLGVNPSTATRMIDRLIAAGLASRKPNPANRRQNELRLTAAGEHIVEQVTARRQGEIASIVERMNPTHRDALVAALNAFAEAGGEPDAGHAGVTGLYPLGWGEPAAGTS